jgi:hypothetical protein
VRNKWTGVVVPVFALLAAVIPTFAHHSEAAEFNKEKAVTLTGTISKVDWMNPHVFVYLDVKDESGKITTWALESSPVLMLHRSGLTKTKLLGNPSDTVTVVAFPAKDGTKALGSLRKISYSDGHFYSFGGGETTNVSEKQQ